MARPLVASLWGGSLSLTKVLSTMSSRAWLVLLLFGCATNRREPAALTPAPPRVVHPTAPVAPTPSPPAPVVTAPSAEPSAPPPAVPGPPPLEKLPGAVWPPPGGWDPPPCELESSTTLVKRGAAYEVRAQLRNLTKKELEVEAPDRCPQGPAVFHGLSEGYDYYGACTAGACAMPREPVRFSLAPGQSLVVATVVIEPAGKSCNAPLAPGKYVLSFGISTGYRLCEGSAAEFEQAGPPEKPRPQSAAKK